MREVIRNSKFQIIKLPTCSQCGEQGIHSNVDDCINALKSQIEIFERFNKDIGNRRRSSFKEFTRSKGLD